MTNPAWPSPSLPPEQEEERRAKQEQLEQVLAGTRLRGAVERCFLGELEPQALLAILDELSASGGQRRFVAEMMALKRESRVLATIPYSERIAEFLTEGARRIPFLNAGLASQMAVTLAAAGENPPYLETVWEAVNGLMLDVDHPLSGELRQFFRALIEKLEASRRLLEAKSGLVAVPSMLPSGLPAPGADTAPPLPPLAAPAPPGELAASEGSAALAATVPGAPAQPAGAPGPTASGERAPAFAVRNVGDAAGATEAKPGDARPPAPTAAHEREAAAARKPSAPRSERERVPGERRLPLGAIAAAGLALAGGVTWLLTRSGTSSPETPAATESSSATPPAPATARPKHALSGRHAKPHPVPSAARTAPRAAAPGPTPAPAAPHHAPAPHRESPPAAAAPNQPLAPPRPAREHRHAASPALPPHHTARPTPSAPAASEAPRASVSEHRPPATTPRAPKPSVPSASFPRATAHAQAPAAATPSAPAKTPAPRPSAVASAHPAPAASASATPSHPAPSAPASAPLPPRAQTSASSAPPESPRLSPAKRYKAMLELIAELRQAPADTQWIDAHATHLARLIAEAGPVDADSVLERLRPDAVLAGLDGQSFHVVEPVRRSVALVLCKVAIDQDDRRAVKAIEVLGAWSRRPGHGAPAKLTLDHLATAPIITGNELRRAAVAKARGAASE